MQPTGDVEILDDRELLEDCRRLEGTTNTRTYDLVRLEVEQIRPCVRRAATGADQARQGIDECRLPGAIRTDQEVQTSRLGT